MKKVVAATMLIMFLMGIIAGCTDNSIKNPITITLNKSSAEISLGDTLQLEAEVEGANETDVVWGSSDTSVATVSQNGLVTAIKQGEAVITAAIDDVSAECEITVADETKDNIFYVDRKNNNINIISKYSGTQDIMVNLNNTGSNNIFNFAGIYLISNDSDAVSTQPSAGVLLEYISSDWIGPHRVFAKNNINGDMTSSIHFTGGNHAYDGAYNGAATGRTSEVQLYIDGEKYDSDISSYANDIEIIWTNYVQASNTKRSDGAGREVLKETFSMRFDGEKYSVEGKIAFLEDVRWDIYYGIQCTNNGSWNQRIFYHNSNNKVWNDANKHSDSQGKDCNMITLNKGSNYLELGLDDSYGIGDRQLLFDGNGALTAVYGQYGKTYYHLANSAHMNKDDEVSYRGYYKFYYKS